MSPSSTPPTLKLVIFGRDGVIGDKVDVYVRSVDEWTPSAGAIEALARLHHTGVRVAVATNQPALGRGLLEMSVLVSIHQRLVRQVETAGGRIDAIAVCPHLPSAGCSCHKPRPGMLTDLMQRMDVKPAETIMIGNGMDDILAARASGAHAWLVRRHGGELVADQKDLPPEVVVIDDVPAAVERILQMQSAAPADRLETTG